MTCVVCGSGELEPHLRVRGTAGAEGLAPTTDRFGTALGDIVRCRACGHMQLDRFPPEELLGEAYGEAESLDYVAEEAGQRATAAALLDRLERLVAGRRLLDLGCWVGFLLSEAAGRGWEARGVEPSEFAASFARDRLGVEVVTAGLFEAELPPASFDAVVMGDVIEHLPRPGDALARVRELLAPAGVLALTLPDAGSRVARALGRRWWSVIPTHVQYFTRASIRGLLAREGYEVLELTTAPKAFTVSYYLGRLGGYWPPGGEVAVTLAERAGVADRLWAPDFRDRMQVIARRS